MVELKVRRFGQPPGVVLPKEVAARLGTGDGALPTWSKGGCRLVPCDPGCGAKPDTLRVLAQWSPVTHDARIVPAGGLSMTPGHPRASAGQTVLAA